MQVLIEVKERESHYEGIVIFPAYLKEEVSNLLITELENIEWIMTESNYRGYINASSSFPSSKKAYQWANKISDQICLVKI